MSLSTRYVRGDAAGGGDGTTNTNSGGTGAWTWAEMLTSAAAGHLVYVVAAGGAIARTTSTDTFTNAGGTQPIWIKGCNSAAGDLDSQARSNSGTGALDLTNFPSITYTTGGLTLKTKMIVEQLKIEGAPTGPVLTGAGTAIVRRCHIRNTHATDINAEAVRDITGATNIIDCDLTSESSGNNTGVAWLSYGNLINCRVRAPSGRKCFYCGNISAAIGCQFLDAGEGVICYGGGGTIANCSFRNISGTYVSQAGGAVVGCVAWGSGGSSKWFAGGGTTNPNIQSHNAVGNMGAADADEGDWPVLSEVSLSADPFTSSSDLRLNSTAGGGADCKTAGIFGNDIGAIQAASAAAGGLLTHPGMAGGMRA